MAMRSKATSLTIPNTGGSIHASMMRPAGPASRVNRYPRHNFRLRTTPWVIHPMMIAPVLPGETLSQLLMQCRAVSDPVKDKLGGWWHEYYWFYVKHTDLADRDVIIPMHVEGASIASLNSAAATQTYHYGGAPNWVQKCLELVTEWYFRDADEAWNVAGSTMSVDGVTMPLAKASDRLWWDSLKLEAAAPTVDQLPGQFDDLPPHMTQFQSAYDQWQFMRENAVTEVTFEDYLRTFGIKAEAPEREDLRKPELIRYVRDWAYPANTINPENGEAASALSWALSERADKARFIREPGFIFGVTVTRPKVYFQGQLGHAAAGLDTPYTWLPMLMQNDQYTSLKEHQHTEGALMGTINEADDYWWDVRDLYLYGDQFVNYDLTDGTQLGDANSVNLPRSSGAGNLQLNYVEEADVNDLFAAWTDDPADNGLNKIRVDGVCSLTIKGHQRDAT